MAWTNKEIDESIDLYIKEVGEIPCSIEFREGSWLYGLPTATVMGRFGGITKYYISRGIQKAKISTKRLKKTNRKPWNKERILVILLPHCKEKGRMLTDKEIHELSKGNDDFPSDKTICRHIGGSEQVAKSLGLTSGMTHRNTWNKKDILDVLLPYCIKVGRMLTYAEIVDLSKKSIDFPSSGTIIKYIGSLEEVARILGFTYITRWSEDKILQVLKPYCKEKGRMLTDNEVRELSKSNNNFPSDKTIRSYIGSFEKVAKLLDVPYITNNSISFWENKVVEYIISTTDEIIMTNTKKVLENGQELDIYIKSLGIAIECNGDYWHSYNNDRSPKDKNYHITKTRLAKSLGITLIHIFESEWEENTQNIKDYLLDIINNITYEAKGDIIAIDNMKPKNYTNIQYIQTTEPKLQSIGGFEIWDCGISYYWVK